jgi:hypothetical protein
MTLEEYSRLIWSAMAKMELILLQPSTTQKNKVELSTGEIEAVLFTLKKMGIKPR